MPRGLTHGKPQRADARPPRLRKPVRDAAGVVYASICEAAVAHGLWPAVVSMSARLGKNGWSFVASADVANGTDAGAVPGSAPPATAA